jgi:hypothetical protein
MKIVTVYCERVFQGVARIRNADGRDYVLIGHEHLAGNAYVPWSVPGFYRQATQKQASEQQGLRVFLTKELMDSTTDDIIWDAELVQQLDGTFELDVSRGSSGVLVYLVTGDLFRGTKQYLRVQLPLVPGRLQVSHIWDHKVHDGQIWLRHSHHFHLIPLLTGESMSVNVREETEVPNTGPTLCHPLRNPQWQTVDRPHSVVLCDGSQVTCKRSAATAF